MLQFLVWHKLIDYLGFHLGFHLDIIWSVSEDTALSIEEHIALFGALQRLKTWHNAHLLVTPIEGSVYNASIEPWVTYLRGEVRCLSDPEDAGSLLDWDLIWRGDLRFSDGKVSEVFGA